MRRFLDRYLGFTLNSIQSFWTYRFRMLIWILYDFVVLGVQYFLWTAIFASSGGSLFGIGVAQYLAYVGLTLIVGRMIAGDIDGDIAQEIKQGDISMSLVKPVTYFTMVASRRLGQTVGFLLSTIPIAVVIFVFIGIPALDPWIAVAGFIAVVQAYVLVTIFGFLLGILAFWITNYWGLFLFKQHIIALFSGEVIALNLLGQFATQGAPHLPIPGLDSPAMTGLFQGLWAISYGLPFQAMSYTPSAIFSGMLTGPGTIALHLGLQAFWIVVLGLLTAWVWSRAQHRITIMGG